LGGRRGSNPLPLSRCLADKEPKMHDWFYLICFITITFCLTHILEYFVDLPYHNKRKRSGK
jgi:hypothetical protein